MPLRDKAKLDKADYEKIHYIWTLYKYIGEKDDMLMGEIVMPVESLGGEMTSEYLLQQLNSNNRFDFEYSPSEGDNLEVRKEYVHKSLSGQQRPDLYDYMSCIYRKGKWEQDYYDFFTDKTRQIKKGKVEFRDEQE
ncbi:hypothetical protein LA313_00520 [Salinimicrobium sp. ASW11-47]|nr:hypothetical protein [Salinimicrobium sediminilitoris]